MKQKYLTPELKSIASPDVMIFVTAYQEVTNRPITQNLCLCDVLDLLRDFSPTFHHEMSDGRFFEHILINQRAPSVFGYDGTDPLYSFWYEAVAIIKRIIVVDSMKRASEPLG